MDTVVARYLEIINELQKERPPALVKGARSLLNSLRDTGVSLFIASGGEERYVESTMRRQGIEHYFGDSVYGRSQRKSQTIRLARRHGRVVLIGDGPYDISAARLVGGVVSIGRVQDIDPDELAPLNAAHNNRDKEHGRFSPRTKTLRIVDAVSNKNVEIDEVEAVVFDLDGTLVESRDQIRRAFIVLTAELLGVPPEATEAEEIGTRISVHTHSLPVDEACRHLRLAVEAHRQKATQGRNLDEILRHVEGIYGAVSLSDQEAHTFFDQLMLFKLGDIQQTRRFASVLSSLIRTHVREPGEWRVAFPISDPPHPTQILGEALCATLQATPLHLIHNHWVVGYPELPPEDRCSRVKGSIRVNESVERQRVIVCDDFIETGATMRERVRAILDAGAQEVRAFVIADWRETVGQERLLYSYLRENRQQSIRALRQLGGDLSQSGIKYLMRALMEEPTDMMKALGLPEDAKHRLARQALRFLPLCQSDHLAALIHLILSAFAGRAYKNLSIESRVQTMLELKRLLSRGELPAEALDTLMVSSERWDGQPSMAVVYAYLAGYNFVVFSDRRTMAPNKTDEAMEAARLLRLTVSSPYFTTLPRQTYVKEEEDQDDLDVAIDDIPGLAEPGNHLRCSRNRVRNAIGTTLPLSHQDYRQVRNRYVQDAEFSFRATCDLLLMHCQSQGLPLSRRDFAIAWVGSFARSSATVESDIEYDILARNEYVAQIIEETFGPLLAHALRLVGFHLGPSNQLYSRHLRTRYQLKTGRLFDRRMRDEDIGNAISRLLDSRLIWGASEIYSNYVARSRVELHNHIGIVRGLFLPTTDRYLELARNRMGRLRNRNWIVAADEERGLMFDPKWFMRVLEFGLKENVFKLLESQPQLKIGSLPKPQDELLRLMNEYVVFSSRLSESTVSEVIDAWLGLVASRERKSVEGGLLKPSSVKPDMMERVEVLSRFVQRHVVEARQYP